MSGVVLTMLVILGLQALVSFLSTQLGSLTIIRPFF